ncbi:MAG: RNA 2',3'-cyclic phosphodiesterase [Acidobacteria bacterium]|nr:RNA 2',3'-cyclic phosphodiesterase [Acidobacteriota bacterium]
MRLFTGFTIPYETRRNLELLLAHLKPTAAIQWSPLDNLHITTRFIGEWPEDRLDEIKDALAGVPGFGPFDISVTGLGWFPNPHKPHSFFAGIAAPEGLLQLKRATDEALEPLGVAHKSERFVPHLTLARLRGTADIGALRAAIAQLPAVDFGRFRATAWNLYESRLGNGPSVYTKLAGYPL